MITADHIVEFMRARRALHGLPGEPPAATATTITDIKLTGLRLSWTQTRLGVTTEWDTLLGNDALRMDASREARRVVTAAKAILEADDAGARHHDDMLVALTLYGDGMPLAGALEVAELISAP